MTDVSCSNCTHYREPQRVPQTSAHQLRGMCQRYPTSVQKLPGEVCGEHPKLAVIRDQSLAGQIADQIAARLGEPVAAPAATGKKSMFRR